MKITGFSLRRALLSRPRALLGRGTATNRPGTCRNIDSKLCEWVGSEPVAGALGHPHDQWHARLSAEHVVDVGGVVDDLVKREQGELTVISSTTGRAAPPSWPPCLSP